MNNTVELTNTKSNVIYATFGNKRVLPDINNIKVNKDEALVTVLNLLVDKLTCVDKNTVSNALAQQFIELELKPTENNNIYVGLGNKYYTVEKNKLVEKNIISMNEDGSYCTENNVINSSDYSLITKYDANNQLCEFYVVSSENEVVKDKELISKLLGLRKEFVNKHKLHGYSGQSFDPINVIANKLSTPIETGYYMDKKYNLYRWNSKCKKFERKIVKNPNPMAQLLYDYDYNFYDTVLRTDYDGYGLSMI